MEGSTVRSDQIVILILALLFFGGIGYLVWSERKKQKLKVSASTPTSPEGNPHSEELQGTRPKVRQK
jgi:Flp pilus assembly protein CpaB